MPSGSARLQLQDPQALPQGRSSGSTRQAAAIAAARNTFDNGTWAYDPQLRSLALLELANRLTERAEAIALTLSREMGKTLGDATLEATVSPRFHSDPWGKEFGV